ncbi:MAG: hypothetical protein C4526_12085 [Nitrospiraceae bacterium]|nr:MAG: hypothetical protein C4526_12085 [Nitrospiraceae bacterium]
MAIRTKKYLLLPVLITGLILIMISAGSGSNNSAPNFECGSCHGGGTGPAEIRVEGLPLKYIPGKTYKMTLTVVSGMQSSGDVAGGFAAQATGGELIAADKNNTQLSEGFLTHTQEGSAFRKWTFKWKAPSEKTGVNLTVMAVAANGDFSPVGDAVGADAYSIVAK